MASVVTTASASTTKASSNVFMPGFLDTLDRDEKILVIFAIAFIIVFVGAAIGSIICILSGTGRRSIYNRRKKTNHPAYINDKSQQVIEYIEETTTSGHRRSHPSSVITGTNEGHLSRSASESYLGVTGLRRIDSSQYSSRKSSRTSSNSPVSRRNKRRKDRLRYVDQKRFRIIHGKPNQKRRNENSQTSLNQSDSSDKYSGQWPSHTPNSLSLPAGYVPKAIQGSLQ